MENRAQIYKKPTVDILTNVCFAPIIRDKLTCKAELYVTSRVSDLADWRGGNFLGYDKADLHLDQPSPVLQDQTKTTRIDVTANDQYLSHIFFEADHVGYLFVMRDYDKDDYDYQTFLNLVSSFVLFDMNVADPDGIQTQPFSDFLNLTQDQLRNLHIKLTYLGPQDKPISTRIVSADNAVDVKEFMQYRRYGLSYQNDDLAIQMLSATPAQLHGILEELNSIKDLMTDKVARVPFLSVAFLSRDPEGVEDDKFFEAILSQAQAEQFYSALAKIFEAKQAQEMKSFFRTWGCSLDILPTSVPEDVTNKVEIVQSGVRLNKTTGLFEQTLTLKNKSDAALIAPIALVLDFEGHTRLTQSNDVTCQVKPAGKEILEIPLPSGEQGSFFPQEELEITLQFLTQDGEPIRYKTKVLSGPGER